jgi:hypothetical protein
VSFPANPTRVWYHSTCPPLSRLRPVCTCIPPNVAAYDPLSGFNKDTVWTFETISGFIVETGNRLRETHSWRWLPFASCAAPRATTVDDGGDRPHGAAASDCQGACAAASSAPLSSFDLSLSLPGLCFFRSLSPSLSLSPVSASFDPSLPPSLSPRSLLLSIPLCLTLYLSC